MTHSIRIFFTTFEKTTVEKVIRELQMIGLSDIHLNRSWIEEFYYIEVKLGDKDSKEGKKIESIIKERLDKLFKDEYYRVDYINV